MTPSQVSILRHTLGLPADGRGTPYRNYFVAGPGHHDQTTLDSLVASGHMALTESKPGFLAADDVLYHVTPIGRDIAINTTPPPRRTKYQEYLDSEFGDGFARWLGIDPPRRQYSNHIGQSLVRLTSPRATGEWCSTLKAAKASYKADMQRRKGLALFA